MLAYYPNVQIIDWAKITADDPSLLGADGYHPSPAGISRLVLETAIALGGSPTGSGGDCLSSRFTDDSAGTVPEQRRRDSDDDRRNPAARTTTTTIGPADRPLCRRAGRRPPAPAPSVTTTLPAATTCRS